MKNLIKKYIKHLSNRGEMFIHYILFMLLTIPFLTGWLFGKFGFWITVVCGIVLIMWMLFDFVCALLISFPSTADKLLE